MKEPQEIEDEEHEQVLERVAAVDVAKASGMACTPFMPTQDHFLSQLTFLMELFL